MQHINNDIDELFKNAAEEYPLKTGKADWDKVFAKLNGINSSYPLSKIVKKSNSLKYAVAIILLFGLGLFAEREIFKTKNNVVEQLTNHVAPLQNHTAKANIPGSTKSGDYLLKGLPGEKKQNIQEKQFVSFNPVNLEQELINPLQILNSEVSFIGGNPQRTEMTGMIGYADQMQMHSSINADQVDGMINELWNKQPVQRGGNEVKPATPSDNQQNSLEESADIQKITISREKRFYAGLLAGMNFSTVKFQTPQSPGLNYGIMMGYKISRNLNIELSMSKTNEYYFTQGKYFSTDKIKFPQGTELVNLEGSSKISQMPVVVRYNFLSKKSRSHFFTSMGVTSFIIHDEKYYYVLNKNGSSFVSDKYYRKASVNIFAGLQVSAGYEAILSKTGDLHIRVEPYYQLPLKGVGLGSLSITNYGINLGVTKNIK